MNVSYHYDRGKRILYGKLQGRVTIEEFESSMKSMLASGDFPPDAKTLWDMREVDFQTIDRTLEERMVAVRRRHPERGPTRIAYLVDDDLGLGMTRMYEILSDDMPQRTRVFTSFVDAEQWLMQSEGSEENI